VRRVLPVLTADAVETLYEKALVFCETKGFKIESPRMLQVLAGAGAQVDQESQVAKLPRGLVESALKTVPQSFALCARDPRHDLVFPHPEDGFYVRTNTGATLYLDPGAEKLRRLRVADVAAWGRLVAQLENIDVCAFGTPADVPQATADIHGLRALLSNSLKHTWIQPYDEQNVGLLLELAAAAAGGETAFRERPLVSLIACSLTPYTFKPMDTEVILQAAAHGAPIMACSLPSQGGTSPVTPIGTALVAGVEILAMVVMAQVLRPGLPVIATPLVFAMDMTSGRVGHSSPEALAGAAAAIQFVKQGLGLPGHTYGTGSDSPVYDQQVSVEAALQAATMAYAGVDLLGAAGQFHTATALSPLQLIIDNEVMGMLKRLVRGPVVDDETLGWETILSVPHGDTFLLSEHTYTHCRDAWRSRLFTRESEETWRERSGKQLSERVLERYEEIMAAPQEPVVSDAVAEAMAQVVKQADERLA